MHTMLEDAVDITLDGGYSLPDGAPIAPVPNGAASSTGSQLTAFMAVKTEKKQGRRKQAAGHYSEVQT